MAQVDVKWPSEDEDFDAKTEGNESEATKVAVVDGSDPDETTETSTDTEIKQDAQEDESSEAPETAPEESSEEVNESSGQDPAAETPSAPEVPDEPAEAEPAQPTEEAPEESTQEAPVAEEVSTPEPEAAAEEPETPTSAEEPAVESIPEPGANVVPEAPSEPVAAAEPTAVNDTASEAEKPQAAATVSKGGGHLGRNLLFVALILVIGGLGAWSWMLYADRDNLQKQVAQLKQNPQDEVQRQSEDIVKKAGAQINLPQGENPTIANVTDAAAAKKESEFFANAKDGDKVLVYVKAGIAVLYRPSTNKVVLVAPLTLQKQTGASGVNTNTQTENTNNRATTNGNALQ